MPDLFFDVLCFEMAPLGLCPCETMRQLFNERNTKECFDFFLEVINVIYV